MESQRGSYFVVSDENAKWGKVGSTSHFGGFLSAGLCAFAHITQITTPRSALSQQSLVLATPGRSSRSIVPFQVPLPPRETRTDRKVRRTNSKSVLGEKAPVWKIRAVAQEDLLLFLVEGTRKA